MHLKMYMYLNIFKDITGLQRFFTYIFWLQFLSSAVWYFEAHLTKILRVMSFHNLSLKKLYSGSDSRESGDPLMKLKRTTYDNFCMVSPGQVVYLSISDIQTKWISPLRAPCGANKTCQRGRVLERISTL